MPALFGRISLIPSTEVIDLGVVNLNRFLDDFKEVKRTKDETMKLLSAAVIEVIAAQESMKSNCIDSILKLNYVF